MPEPVAANPGPNPEADDNPELEKPEPIEGPPDEEFWDKYNKRLEFPIATVASVLTHVVIATGLVFALLSMANKDNGEGPPVKLVSLNGLDDDGLGSSGSGGDEDPIFKSQEDPVKSAIDSLADPSKLPDIKEEMKQTIKTIDPSGKIPITDANAAAYKSLNESIRNKLLGARQGAGNEAGTGFDGSKGKGPGGTGSDSTLGRNMRWTLRFKVNSGRDYVHQLRAMGAEILVPERRGSDKCILVKDLNNPHDHAPATDDDLRRLANKIKFSDNRREVVGSVAQTMGLEFRPDEFWAFFPKELEQELARKETGFANKRSEDIEETVFSVSVTPSGYSINVDKQTLKK